MPIATIISSRPATAIRVASPAAADAPVSGGFTGGAGSGPQPSRERTEGRPVHASSIHHLGELALPVALDHHRQRDRLDLAALAGAPERLVTREADLADGLAGRLEVLARVELVRMLGEEATDGAGHREPDVGVDVDLAHAVLDG